MINIFIEINYMFKFYKESRTLSDFDATPLSIACLSLTITIFIILNLI